MPEPAAGGVPDYLAMPVGEFLSLLSAGDAAPGGGAAAALAVALAAGLCAMAARLSAKQFAGSPGSAQQIAEDAERLRDHVAPLAQADAEAYLRVIAALRLSRDDPRRRRQAIAGALSDAAGVPMRVAEIAVQVARLAARLGTQGNPNLRGDAMTAAALAEAGARAAAALVRLNLTGAPADDRPARAENLVREAADAAAQTRQT